MKAFESAKSCQQKTKGLAANFETVLERVVPPPFKSPADIDKNVLGSIHVLSSQMVKWSRGDQDWKSCWQLMYISKVLPVFICLYMSETCRNIPCE